jgi:Uma2 family endonuclease
MRVSGSRGTCDIFDFIRETPYTPNMAEPARNLPTPRNLETEDDESGFPVLQRWAERSDGRLELLVRPLTSEDFLNPQLEDTMPQGEPHASVRRQLADLLDRRFKPDAIVLKDVIHVLGPGLPSPSPDISVILGARPGERPSFSVPEEDLRPDLIIEIVSPSSKKIRDVDEVDKVEAYSRAGIPNYLLLDLPRRGNGYRLGLKGYQLDSEGRYRPIVPDAQGRLLCEAIHLRFFIPPEGDRVRVIDDRTGQPLLYSDEEEAARKAAEAETSRLREELERLKSKTPS